jgi:hypothetical protein
MGLRKDFTDNNTGATQADAYWRIVNDNRNYLIANATHVVFYGYANQAAREAGKSNIPALTYEFDYTFTDDAQPTMADLYTAAKAQPGSPLSGASDVMGEDGM